MTGSPHHRVAYEYALIRVVPRVQRGEFVNVGAIVYCREREFLGAQAHVDEPRLRALAPTLDVAAVRAALDSVTDTCGERGDGPASAEQIGRRFRWLTAPRSTVVQTSPVHTGLTADPARELELLMTRLVLPAD